MFENLTYKQKFITLVVVVTLLAIAANKRSFKLTKNAYEDYQIKKKELDYVESTPNNIHNLDYEISFLDNLIGNENLEPELVQQEILNFVTNTDYKVQVVNVTEIHEASSNDFNIYTNQLTITGDFESIVSMVYEFEKKFSYSRVVNINFFKKKNFKTRKIQLYAKIIFQNYEKNK